MENQAPVWTEPVDLGDAWPLREVTLPELSCRLALPEEWEQASLPDQTHLTIEATFRGEMASELAIISYMPQADPSGDIRNWVEGIVAVTGFPIPAMIKDTLPNLLEWENEGKWPALAEQLSVDECHTYQGLAYLPDSEAEIARFYILLARRGQQAWKIVLSFLSACLPGTPEEDVYNNDHVRAAATFGTLELL